MGVPAHPEPVRHLPGAKGVAADQMTDAFSVPRSQMGHGAGPGQGLGEGSVRSSCGVPGAGGQALT